MLPRSALLLLLLTLPLCAKADLPEAAQRQLLATTAQQVIYPAVTRFYAGVAALEGQAEAFCAAPSRASLAAARSAWRGMMARWYFLSVYRIGPLRQGFPAPLDWQIDTHLVSGGKRMAEITSAIERVEQGTGPINALTIARQKLFSRGIHAIEPLLYSDRGGQPADLAGVLASYQGEVGERRCRYLVAQSDYLLQLAQTLYDAWRPEGDNYVQQLAQLSGAAAAAYASPKAALDGLYNAAITALQYTRNNRLAEALLDPQQAESALSGSSLANVAAVVAGFERWFKGPEESGPQESSPEGSSHQGGGYEALLRTAGQGELADEVNAQIETIKAALAALPPSLTLAIDEAFEQVKALEGQVSALNYFMRLEVAEALEVGLAFNEEDGD